MATVFMFALLFSFMAIGVPIGVCLLFPIFLMLIIDPSVTSPQFLTQVLYSGVADFSKMSLPFFILAGGIMDVGGISKRLVRIANSLVGEVTGSLGTVAVIACMFFGAVSGSAPATCAAIGTIMLPEMVRAGYNKYYAVALITAAGGLGVIVPPSYPMVIYGVTNNVPIGDLFIAGLGPALLVGILLIIVNYIYCKRHGIRGETKASFKEFLSAMRSGAPALLMPVIILGGIYSGVFTTTEAAVISCVYGILVGLFIYRELKLPKLIELYRSNAIFIGGTMLTMAPASTLGKIFAILGVNRAIQNLFLSVTANKYVILLIIFGILFVAGMFVQTTPCMVILSPLMLNVVSSYGIDPVHFGITMVLALCIAFITPPVAANLFVTSSMTGIPINKIVPKMLPFMAALIVALILVGFFPIFSTIFPSLFSLIGG